MSITTTLGGAFAASAILLAGFAFLRRVMRAPTPPRLLDSNLVAFASALLFTIAIMVSMLNLGFALFPFTGSVSLAVLAAIVIHLLFWAVVRVMVPLRDHPVAAGKSAGGNDPTPGGLPAH